VFDEGIAAAAADAPKSPILVSIFLQGGADSLSMLYPDGDPLYHKYRQVLGVTGGTVFAEDDRLFWHPALAPLATLRATSGRSARPTHGC
jgi:uncharacterized protein (DUF1501 family)